MVEWEKLRELERKATPGPWEATLCEWNCDCFPCPKDCEKEPDDCGNGCIINGAYIDKIKTVEYGDYCDMNDDDARFITAMRNAFPALLEEVERLREERRWIPVGERLPDGTCNVWLHLSKNGYTDVLIGYYNANTGRFQDTEACLFNTGYIKHWMPREAPKPPKEDAE